MKNKTILFGFLSFIITFTLSCQSEDIAEVETKAATLNVKSYNGIYFTIKDNRIVFENSTDYAKLYNILSNASPRELNNWKQIAGIKTLSDKYKEESANMAFEERDYTPEDLTSNHAKGMLPYLFNNEGVLQYADTILVIKKDKMVAVLDGDEKTVNSIIEDADIQSLTNVLVNKHFTKLEQKLDYTNGMQKVMERSIIVETQKGKIRQFVEFEAYTINQGPNLYTFRIQITGYQQNKFVWWWFPAQNPMEFAKISFNGTLNGIPVAFNGTLEYNIEQLWKEMPPIVTVMGPNVQIVATYKYRKNWLLDETRVITYSGSI